MKEQYNEQAFLENANEAATKIREIYHIFGGYGKTSSPEEGTLLGDVYARIWDMVSLYLVSITGKDLYSDEINDMTRDIIKEYCKVSAQNNVFWHWWKYSASADCRKDKI